MRPCLMSSIHAGRISYVFGLSGPCMAIDTACSSGLVAIANAHNALMLGAVPAALAGGVNLLLSPTTHAMYAVAGGSLEDLRGRFELLGLPCAENALLYHYARLKVGAYGVKSTLALYAL